MTSSRHIAGQYQRYLVGLYVLVSLVYLTWRVLFTFAAEAPVYSTLFFLGELAAVLAGILFYLQLAAPRPDPEPPPPPPGLGVDVFIATYNEDPALVRTTAVAARDMHYPHRTWILDDGRRESVRALAAQIGVGYLTRPSNEHYKAGNLNHALAQTDGDLVVTFDADHVPRRDFLLRTIGYFQDRAVGFVQTPQVYYNVDSFQHSVSLRRRRVWHEAAVFHHALQPGAAHFNAAFYVGTGTVLRRAALAAVGGFATGSITEDIHTSLRMHARGWQSRYVNEALGFMLAADTPLAYLVQRLRWAQGSMQLLRMENPLWQRGLGFWQRLSYLNSLGVYLFSYQHLLFYLTPALYLVFGLSPIAVEQPGVLGIFVGYIGFSLLIYKALVGVHGRLFLSEIFRMTNLSAFILASLTLIEPHGLRFRVTPKGDHSGLPWPFLLVPAILLLLNLTAAGIGVALPLLQPDWPWSALVLATVFAGYFALVAAVALVHAVERGHSAEAFAFPARLAAELVVGNQRLPVRIARLNQSHVFVRTATATLPDSTVHLEIPALGLHQLPVRRIGLAPGESGAAQPVLKLGFEHLDDQQRQVLDRYFFETAIPEFFGHFAGSAAGPAPAVVGQAAAPGQPAPELLPIRKGML